MSRERSPAANRKRFGAFELDPVSGELRKGEARFNLPDQPLRVLTMLLERPGELVTREELRQRLWQQDTFVDFDQGLNSAVRRLRDMLGDSAERSTYIETVPRRGYRFISAVVGPPPPEPAPPELPRSRYRLGKVLVATAASAVAVGVVLAWPTARRNPGSTSDERRALHAMPLTSLAGREFEPVLSPDGQRVAFLWDRGETGAFDLYQKVVGSETLLRLTSDHRDKCCAGWSPDGRFLSFIRLPDATDGRHTGSVHVVPALGGPERRLGAVRPWYGSTTAWSPDGEWIAVSTAEGVQDRPALRALPVDGGPSRLLTNPGPGTTGDAFPAYSPDGSQVAFVRVLSRSDALTDSRFYLVPAAGGDPRPLSTGAALVAGLDWRADGKALIFTGGRGEPRLWTLWTVDVESGPPQLLPGFTGSDLVNAAAESVNTVSRASRVSVSRSGQRLAFSRGSYDTDIWRLALGGNGAGPAGAPTRWLSSTQVEEAPHFSPDATAVVFASTRASTTPEIWIVDAAGTTPVQLTSLKVHSGSPQFSPDGRRVAFDSRPRGNSDIHVLDVDSRHVRALTSHTSEDVLPRWSHDGRTLYFASDRGGTWQIWSVPADGSGPERRVLDTEGFASSQAADGTLYYTKFGQNGLWRSSPQGGGQTPVLDGLRCWGYWTPGAEGIYYVGGPGDREIRYQPFKGGVSRRVAETPGPPACGEAGMALSPDESTLLVVAVSQGSDLMLLDGVR